MAPTRNLHYSVGQKNQVKTSTGISNEYPVIDHEFDAVVVGAGNF